MLKDTGIPPMQFREKTCVREHRSLGKKTVEILLPHGNKGGHVNDIFRSTRKRWKNLLPAKESMAHFNTRGAGKTILYRYFDK